MTPAQLTRLTEAEARELIEAAVWLDGPVCPLCGETEKITKMGGKAAEKGLYKCNVCRRNFSVRKGTIFEDSPIVLRDWLYAITRMCCSKKGVSAHQIHRELGITYKSAWFMCHRIRWAFRDDSDVMMDGTVEADETYVGPRKPRHKGTSKRGRGTAKQPVAALVQRGGRAKARVVCDVTARTLKENIRENVDPGATLMSDEWSGYRGIGSEFRGGHQTVDHASGEYSRGNVHVNEAESYFSLLKRALIGAWHHTSKRHLERYLSETDFRWNARKVDDVSRVLLALMTVKGKRLTYRPLTEAA